ncbi:MAG TPA: ABC transporter ATP-binding protein, partial [Sulfitobacter pontiacus]|nr:ABC transporter ATP-binding protein [Sulfitobacter pontiacus]
MTQKPTFTLTITNGNQGRMAAADAARPKAENANRPEDRLMARAKLAATYAGLLGVTTAPRDIFEIVATAPLQGNDPQVEAEALARGMESAGLVTQVSRARGISKDMWPALAYMTSGQVLLVMGQQRGDLILYDTTCTDNRAMVPISDFKPFFAGLILRAEASLKTVAETHKTDGAPAHWFWGQFPRFRRQLIEVATGSFVANLLAVAVALFSLQVYDRVIPHQSEATLWVLAAGAGLALLMEAFLKMARARLMDGAGRQ